MGMMERAKKLKQASPIRGGAVDVGRLAGDAVMAASEALKGAESVAERTGLTKRDGSLSKVRLAKAAVQPRKTARAVLDATADEVRARRDTNTTPPES